MEISTFSFFFAALFFLIWRMGKKKLPSPKCHVCSQLGHLPLLPSHNYFAHLLRTELCSEVRQAYIVIITCAIVAWHGTDVRVTPSPSVVRLVAQRCLRNSREERGFSLKHDSPSFKPAWVFMLLLFSPEGPFHSQHHKSHCCNSPNACWLWEWALTLNSDLCKSTQRTTGQGLDPQRNYFLQVLCHFMSHIRAALPGPRSEKLNECLSVLNCGAISEQG